MSTYLIETMSVSVHRISERTPRTVAAARSAVLARRRGGRLAKGVERAGADVAEDDAERAEREREEPGPSRLACPAVPALGRFAARGGG